MLEKIGEWLYKDPSYVREYTWDTLPDKQKSGFLQRAQDLMDFVGIEEERG